MTLKEQVSRAIEGLGEPELRQVVDYVTFLRFRSRVQPPSLPEENELAALYAESAEEDRELAEQGIEDYSAGLRKEDAH